MKKVLAVLMVLVLVAGGLVGGYFFGKGKGADEIMSHVYPRTAVVCAVDYYEDLVIVVDGVGFEWSFYGVEDWEVGDMVSLIMEDNGTETITDDAILDANYAGQADWYTVEEVDG